MNSKKKKVVCVLSMHRSGSSMLMRVLNICGVYIGDSVIREKLLDNKKGHWENRKFLEINERILEIYGGAWEHPPQFPESWEDDERLNDLYTEARNAVDVLFEEADLIGFKDPRMCLTLPFWKKVVPHMKYIIPIRHPQEVAMSLFKRNGIQIKDGIILWVIYWSEILHYTKDDKRIFVFYRDMVENPQREMQRIIDFMDHDAFYIDAKRQKIIDNFISPQLHHNRCNEKNDKLCNNIYEIIFYMTANALLTNSRELERDGKFYVLENLIAQKDQEIVSKNAQISQKDQEIVSKNAQISQKDQEIVSKNAQISQKDQEIALIKSSKFWRLREIYIKMKNKCFFLLLHPGKCIKKYCKKCFML